MNQELILFQNMMNHKIYYFVYKRNKFLWKKMKDFNQFKKIKS